jgi:anti-sigma regulatory factor (Ser/Thr protein kinase)
VKDVDDPATVFRQTWPARAEHLAAIRAAVRSRIAALGVGGDAADDIVLAVNEAASNAVEHAYRPPQPPGTVEVGLAAEAGTLTVDVRDQGRWLLREAESGERRLRGRGLVIMRAVLDAVRVDTGPLGTHVLATVWIGGSAPV